MHVAHIVTSVFLKYKQLPPIPVSYVCEALLVANHVNSCHVRVKS
jgi:hypothetical protein